ncbi:MAG: rhomboid family intramembrane serine protease [Verrucomicrobiota bacterium]
MSQEPPVTLLIIAATAGLTAWAFYNPRILQRLILDNKRVTQGRDYLRLVSSGFIHADWIHFAFNMFSFYSFAGSIERIYGPVTLLSIYLGSILASSIFALVVNRGNPYRALGASGGVCGIIFGSIFLLPGGSIFIIPIPVPIPSWVYAFIFIGVSIFAMGRSGGISHEAHIGGALSGVLITTALYPQIATSQPILYLSLLAFCVVLGWAAPKIQRRSS